MRTEIDFIMSFFKRNEYGTSFVFIVISRFMNKCNNHNQQSCTDSADNSSNLNRYVTVSYLDTPSIKLGKHIAALFRDRVGTDIKIAC